MKRRGQAALYSFAIAVLNKRRRRDAAARVCVALCRIATQHVMLRCWIKWKTEYIRSSRLVVKLHQALVLFYLSGKKKVIYIWRKIAHINSTRYEIFFLLIFVFPSTSMVIPVIENPLVKFGSKNRGFNE